MAAPADIAAFLKSVKLFGEFTDSELLAFAGRLEERNLKPRQVLFREGDPGEEMFVVRKGTSIISKVVSGRIEQVLARAEAGDFFGEMSLFDRSPRSATIQDRKSTRLNSSHSQISYAVFCLKKKSTPTHSSSSCR